MEKYVFFYFSFFSRHTMKKRDNLTLPKEPSSVLYFFTEFVKPITNTCTREKRTRDWEKAMNSNWNEKNQTKHEIPIWLRFQSEWTTYLLYWTLWVLCCTVYTVLSNALAIIWQSNKTTTTKIIIKIGSLLN